MADIKVRIEVNPNAESEVLGDVNNVNAEISNVSVKTSASNVFQNIPTSESSGINGLSFAQDFIFDEQGYVDNEDMQGGVIESEQNPTEFVWGVVPENKQYSVKLTFTNAQNLKDIVVYGDKTVNQFPTRAIIDGTTEIFSDDYRWAINLQTESDTHTIEFTHWNRANYNACLTLIRIMMRYFEVDNRNGLKTVESLSQSTGQPKEIYYGIVPNSGSLEMIDVNGELYDYINDGVIEKSNVKMDVMANGNIIQEHISTDSNYANKILVVDVSDFLSHFDKIYYKGFSYTEKSASLYDIVIDAKNNLPEIYSSKFLLDDKFLTKIKQINYTTPFVPYMTYKDFFNKVCQITQTQLIQNDDGYFVFVDATHTFDNLKDVIIIQSKNIKANSSSKDTILKNKVKRIEYRESSFIRDTDKNIESITVDNESDRYTVVSNKKGVYNYFTNPVGIRYMQGARIENIIYNGSFNIPKSVSIEKLNRAYISIDSGQKIDNSTATVKYISSALYDLTDVDTQKAIWEDFNRTFQGNYIVWSASSLPQNTTPLGDVSIAYIDINDGTEKTLSLEHSDSVQIVENEDNYTINYSVNVFNAKYYLESVGGQYGNENCEISTVNRFTISVKGVSSELKFTNEIKKIGDLESIDYVSLPDNELNQKGLDTYDTIANSILEDYENGLTTAKITIFCTDLYNISGEKAKIWGAGEVVEVGDIIRVDKDNEGTSMWAYPNGEPMYWRVTGRTFKKSGVPLIDLELQEIKVVG